MRTSEVIKEINSRIELVNRYYAGLAQGYTEVLEMVNEVLLKQEPMKPEVDEEIRTLENKLAKLKEHMNKKE